MRLWIFSDLHLTHAGFSVSPPECDLAVVAGDVDVPLPYALMGVEQIVGDTSAIYVPGNHCYYNHNFDQLQKDWVNQPRGVVMCMDRMTTVINGVRFICATLWTDYNLYGNPKEGMDLADWGMNDHRLIMKGTGQLFRARDALLEHQHSAKYIETILDQPFDGKTVVVTHHCPHPNSIHEMFRHPRFKALNPAFASDLSYILDKNNAPDLWIHGHTHHSFDYTVGKTRVICNPKGYKNENPQFNPQLVIEI